MERQMDDVLKHEPIIEFTADPDLDALYKQAVAVAKEHGWETPDREEFEKRYQEEIAASRKNQNEL